MSMSRVSPIRWESAPVSPAITSPVSPATKKTDTKPRSIWSRIGRSLARRSAKVSVEDISFPNPPHETSADEISVATPPPLRPAAERISTFLGRSRGFMSPAPRRSESLGQRNYTQHACDLADKHFEEHKVSSAREIFEELLDTPAGRDFVNLQAAVLRARKRGIIRIRLQRESVETPWGVLFFKPSQLKALGWTSDQYLLVQKLQETTLSSGKSPAVKAGLAVGDIIIGVNGEKIKEYDTFISCVKTSCSLSLLVVKPGTNPMEDDEDDEDLDNAEEYLMQRVLGQARKNVQVSLSKMRRLGSKERIRHLDQCV